MVLVLATGENPVIRKMDLSVEVGEIAAILGRNGAGKSTTLMAIAGLLPGTRGDIRVDGNPVKGPAFRRCRSSLALMLEGRSVFPSLTVAQISRSEVSQFMPRSRCFRSCLRVSR